MANNPKSTADLIAAEVEKLLDKSKKQSAKERVSGESILEVEGEIRQSLLSIQKDALRKLKKGDERHEQIEKLLASENKRLMTLDSDLKKNEEFEKRIRTNIAKSRLSSEKAAAAQDDFSQKTASLTATGKGLTVNDADLDRLIQSYAEDMASTVTQMRALGLPAKEFAKKTQTILDGFDKSINVDPAFKVESDTAKKAKQIILGILEEHKKNVADAGSLSPLALLGKHLAGGLKEKVSSTIKAIPGMGAMGKLADIMNIRKPGDIISRALTGKSEQDRETDKAVSDIEAENALAAQDRWEEASYSGHDADTAARSAAGSEEARMTLELLQQQLEALDPLTRIAETLEETKKQDKEIHENETAERAEVRQDAEEQPTQLSLPLKDEPKSNILPGVFPWHEDDDDKPSGGGIFGAVGDVASTAVGSVVGTGAANIATGLVSRVAGGGGAAAAANVAGGVAGGAGVRRFVPAAPTAVPKGTAAKGASKLLGGRAAMFAGAVPLGHGGLMAGLAKLGTAVTSLAPPILLIGGALYAAYEIFKRVDFSAILKPLAKSFGILKDIVMSVGGVVFKGLMVVGKMVMEILYGVYWALQKVFDGFAFVLQPIFDVLALVLTPVVDLFGELWEATKPLVKAVGDFFDMLLQADSIWVELAGILKRGFVKLITNLWNAIASRVPFLDVIPDAPDVIQRDPSKGGFRADPGIPSGEDSLPSHLRPPAGGTEDMNYAPTPSGGGDAYAGLRIKGSSGRTQIGGSGQATGGGKSHDGVTDLARMIQGNVPGLTRFTAFNDNHHQASRTSKHAQGLALDFTVDGGKKDAPKAAATVRRIIADAGVPPGGADVIDEYTHPSPGSTAGHIHAEFNTESAASKMAGGALIESPTPVPSGQPWWMGRETFAGRTSTTQMPGSPPPRLITRGDTAGASRSGAGVATATARHASQTEAAPMIVANVGGPSVPAPPAAPQIIPIPLPVNAQNPDQVLRALYSVNHV